MYDLCLTVAYPDSQSFDQPHVPDGSGIKLEWIVEKSSTIKNPRNPLTNQHHCIRGIWRNYRRQQFARLLLISQPERLARIQLAVCQRQNVLPPSHDPIRFREKPVSAEIHTVAAIVD